MYTAIAVGIALGIITGLTPGVHVNLVATLALALGATSNAAPALVALAVTHTFLDTIPGVLLGAPEADTALGMLPGHRYLLRGWGYMAVKLTLVGSLLGLGLAVALTPLWLLIITLYPLLVSAMGYLLLGVSAYMILRDNKPYWALLVYILASILGLALLNTETLNEPLFPLFSGLFGVSTLLYSLKQTPGIPPQEITDDIKLRAGPATKAILAGNASGFLTSMLPGLGAAQAAVLGMHLSGRIGDHGFLIMLGTISTVNFTLSLLTWLVLDKARNGAVLAIQTLTPATPPLVAQLIAVALIAGAAATALGLLLGRAAIKLLNAIPYRAACISVITLISILVATITGTRGLLVLATSTALGLVPAIVKTSRAHAMGCLMFPVALWFL